MPFLCYNKPAHERDGVCWLDIQQSGNIRKVEVKILIYINLDCGVKRVLDIKLVFHRQHHQRLLPSCFPEEPRTAPR